MARNAAELTNAFISATVPKVNVVIGEAFGSAYLTMNSKSTGADMVYAWPSAQIGMMDAKLAAKYRPLMRRQQNMLCSSPALFQQQREAM